MIKVLVLTTYFYPATGGVAMHTFNLYSRIAKDKNFDIYIVSASKEKTSEFLNGMKVERLPYWFKISNTPVNLFWFFEINRIIKNYKPDVIVVHTPVPFMSDIGAILVGKISLIVKYHHAGSMLKGKFFPDLLIRAYESTVFRYVMNKANKIISASNFTARNFLKDYKSKTVAITPGVDTKRFKPVKFKNKNRIFFLGSLNKAERYKGLEYLIQALPYVKEKLKNTKLIVVSPGDFMYFYESLARKKGVYKDVVFMGKVLGGRLVEELQKSSVVVLPSTFESCPNILLEAMACAKPIVAANSTGIPDLVTNGKNGFLVDPTNPKDIAQKIIRILENPKLARRMGKNGLERVKKEYTWERKVLDTKILLKKIIS